MSQKSNLDILRELFWGFRVIIETCMGLSTFFRGLQLNACTLELYVDAQK